jgi:hypothetical protein
MLYYSNGMYTACVSTKYTTIPVFMQLMINHRLARFGCTAVLTLEGKGMIRVEVSVHEDAKHLEAVKVELEQIIKGWSR